MSSSRESVLLISDLISRMKNSCFHKNHVSLIIYLLLSCNERSFTEAVIILCPLCSLS